MLLRSVSRGRIRGGGAARAGRVCRACGKTPRIARQGRRSQIHGPKGIEAEHRQLRRLKDLHDGNPGLMADGRPQSPDGGHRRVSPVQQRHWVQVDGWRLLTRSLPVVEPGHRRRRGGLERVMPTARSRTLRPKARVRGYSRYFVTRRDPRSGGHDRVSRLRGRPRRHPRPL